MRWSGLATEACRVSTATPRGSRIRIKSGIEWSERQALSPSPPPPHRCRLASCNLSPAGGVEGTRTHLAPGLLVYEALLLQGHLGLRLRRRSHRRSHRLRLGKAGLAGAALAVPRRWGATGGGGGRAELAQAGQQALLGGLPHGSLGKVQPAQRGGDAVGSEAHARQVACRGGQGACRQN